jgi:mannose-6-phosphate isomerase-like protein (cupin superfamily)/DNA-binding Xre family transcriptional regulator
MLQIGAQIRKIRKLRKVSLTALANTSGVQLATLSRMENGRMTGTLQSHLLIAKALGVDIVDLYQGIQEESQPEVIDEQVEVSSPPNDKVAVEILSRQPSTKRMLPALIRIEPKSSTSTDKSDPGTEMFVFVVEGKVTIHIKEQTIDLERNSSLYFNASLPYSFENTGNVPVKLISVTTPVKI